ncbi:hypothetical protein Msil_3154 [Methylocella silvestris BL2]|uniref:Uncharacterized protein n=1 Tax=Methylocella silvestris (strain DSM 15510 / CIP 108128 / LMG 27833 / NCIMB 13906 / BL2) TaxID=395965 RepID=B8EMD5_METSB|nr:hypothetical protein [Methylocella silvestris]ACK52063.1 hypothetical protein Msil_3154 [Methylocella silvestris BL2]
MQSNQPTRIIIPLSAFDDDARDGVLNACIRDFCRLRGVARSEIMLREVISISGVETAEITIAAH